jgi:hypothetical protein
LDYFLATTSRSALWLIQARYSVVTEKSFSGDKEAGAINQSPSGAEVNNIWSSKLTPPCLQAVVLKHKASFTFEI